MRRMRFTSPALVLTLLVAGVGASQEPATSVISEMPPQLPLSTMTASGHWELRVYTINRGRLDDFVAAWLEGVYPLRLEHGFKIPAAWLSRENNQFIWILGYDGQEDWEAKQRAYYGSSQRQSLAVDPLDLIAHGETWTLSAIR